MGFVVDKVAKGKNFSMSTSGIPCQLIILHMRHCVIYFLGVGTMVARATQSPRVSVSHHRKVLK
jgi:hypothetical protein